MGKAKMMIAYFPDVDEGRYVTSGTKREAQTGTLKIHASSLTKRMVHGIYNLRFKFLARIQLPLMDKVNHNVGQNYQLNEPLVDYEIETILFFTSNSS